MGETSESIRKRVQATRNIQQQRFASSQSDIICNADMRAAMTQLNLSARAYHRILKLARTIADLAGCEDIGSAHLAEALQYRPKIMLG